MPTLARKFKRKLRQFKVLKKKITHFKCRIDQSCTLNALFQSPKVLRTKTVLFSPKARVIWFLDPAETDSWPPLGSGWCCDFIGTVCHVCGRGVRQGRTDGMYLPFLCPTKMFLAMSWVNFKVQKIKTIISLVNEIRWLDGSLNASPLSPLGESSKKQFIHCNCFGYFLP